MRGMVFYFFISVVRRTAAERRRVRRASGSASLNPEAFPGGWRLIEIPDLNPNSETGATGGGRGAALVAAGFPACRITRLPAGCSWVIARAWIFVRCETGGRDAARYVRQDARRYGLALTADLFRNSG